MQGHTWNQSPAIDIRKWENHNFEKLKSYPFTVSKGIVGASSLLETNVDERFLANCYKKRWFLSTYLFFNKFVVSARSYCQQMSLDVSKFRQKDILKSS